MRLFSGKEIISDNIKTASGFMDRFMGLMGQKSISEDLVMYFPACNSIHTYFMKIPIDVIMLDRKGQIVFIRENVVPWNMAFCFMAKDTIEMKSGAIRRFELKIGGTLTIK